MKKVAVAVWSARDRVFVLLSFLAFGVWSIFAPTASMATLPDGAEYMTYAEFILASVFLVYGSAKNAFVTYMTGHVLLIVGLITVAGVIFFTSSSSVSVLIFGYASGIAVSMQNTLRERRLLAEVTADLSEQTQPDGLPISKLKEQ